MSRNFQWTLPYGILLSSMNMLCAFGIVRAQDTVKLTGSWKVQPAINSAPGTSCAGVPRDSVNSLWYEKEFKVPAAWEGRRVVADFRRIEGDAIVFCNHRRVSELLRPGGEVELTSYVRSGSNLLEVFVTRNYTDISRGFADDPLRYQVRQLNAASRLPVYKWSMGITAPVNIIARPQQAVTYVACVSSYRKKRLTLEVDVDALRPRGSYVLEAVVTDSMGRQVLRFSTSPMVLAEGVRTYTLSAAWPNPVCWELDRSCMYKVSVALKQGGQVRSLLGGQPFGFREIWTEGNKLYMNGHLSRWRLTDLYSTGVNGLSFYRLMGYNVGQVQPHSNLWWRDLAETPMPDEAMLNEMDRLGMGCTLPGPSVSLLRGMLLSSAKAQVDYEREASFYIRHYFNHPCILAWVVSMNSANPKANIQPQSMGKRDTSFSPQAHVIQEAYRLVKRVDSTRLVFTHADGSVGDVSTANVYLNFVPLQEREEWPMEWARHGNMPYSAVEFGTPYWNNFWRGHQFLLTEFMAMYLGDEAYRTEGAGALEKVIDAGMHPGAATWGGIDFRQYPAFWEFQRLFTHNTTRAWRTWGVNAGWLHWLLEGYGDPPGKKAHWTQRYRSLEKPLGQRPAWANPRFDIFSEDNHPLLAWLAGSPVPTDKTHTFFSGETIRKQVAVVWDGHNDIPVTIAWQLRKQGRTIARMRRRVMLAAGCNRLIPLSCKAPVVRGRETLQLLLTVEQGRQRLHDTLVLDVFPAFAPEGGRPEVQVYDPKGKTTGWLQRLGYRTIPLSGGAHPDTGITLIIGREALQPGRKMPFTLKDVGEGLRVIIMEQQPQVWESMGFRTIETMPRYVFIRDAHNPAIAGLYPRDLINWRGSPDLLPEGRAARPYATQHAPKWTNRHAVASVALQIPEATGFTPVLQTEFDMDYSPLLEWVYGRGRITFCTLDLTGRIASDPAATLLARQLVAGQHSPVSATRPVFYSGDEAGRQLLRELRVPLVAQPDSGAVWVIGDSPTVRPAAIESMVNQGGTVCYLPQMTPVLAQAGLKGAARTFMHISDIADHPLLRGIGPSLVRVRDSLYLLFFDTVGQPAGVEVLLDGLVLVQRRNAGRKVYLQVSPRMLEARCDTRPDEKEAVQLSVVRLHQLAARLLTNLSVGTDIAAGERLVMAAPAKEGSFYVPLYKDFDPYQFNYW